MNLPPHRPPDREIHILSEGFFGMQGMLRSEWINWAIGYTDSDLQEVMYKVSCGLVEYYDYCKVLQQACLKYLEENR